MKNFLLSAFIWIIFLHIPIVNAYSIKEEEWPFLPAWCDYTQYGRKYLVNYSKYPQQIQVLIKKIGERNWLHIHHYCMALANIYRSYGIGLTEQQRRYELSTAIGGIDYVFRNTSSDLIIRPELFTKKGHILLRLKQYAEAERNLYNSIREKATYWPAYGYLADLYLEQGQNEKARKVLEKGLKVVPNAKGLKNRLATIKKSSK